MGFLAGLRNDVRGNILVVFAFILPAFIGAAGLATDTIIWALWKREIQRAADSAAIAGALTVQQARYRAERAAIHDFKKSRAFEVGKAQMWFENSPHQGPWKQDKDAVLVRVRLKTSLPFSQFFLNSPMFLETEAVATLAKGLENCVIALDESAASAVTFAGNSKINLNCPVTSNSDSSEAVYAIGSSSITAPFVYSVGGIVGSRQYGESVLKPYSPPQVDPFRDLPTPQAPFSCNKQVVQMSNAPAMELSPGCYEGLSLSGVTKLRRGTYYITTADVDIGSSAQITGAGVTLILMKAGRSNHVPQLLVNGTPKLDLSAPQEGDYKNVLVYQSRGAVYDAHKPNTIGGNSLSKIAGGLYFPNQGLKFTGNTGMNLGCFKMVSRAVEFTGNAHFANDCPEQDGRFATVRVRLVN